MCPLTIKSKQSGVMGSSKNIKLASASGIQSANDDYEVQKLLSELGADVVHKKHLLYLTN